MLGGRGVRDAGIHFSQQRLVAIQRGGICIGSEKTKFESRGGGDLVTKRISPPARVLRKRGPMPFFFFPTGDRGVAEVFVHGSPPATASPSRDREPLRAAVAVNDSIS